MDINAVYLWMPFFIFLDAKIKTQRLWWNTPEIQTYEEYYWSKLWMWSTCLVSKQEQCRCVPYQLCVFASDDTETKSRAALRDLYHSILPWHYGTSSRIFRKGRKRGRTMERKPWVREIIQVWKCLLLLDVTEAKAILSSEILQQPVI